MCNTSGCLYSEELAYCPKEEGFKPLTSEDIENLIYEAIKNKINEKLNNNEKVYEYEFEKKIDKMLDEETKRTNEINKKIFEDFLL